MKTTDPARYFRNTLSPAARLARWQRLPLADRLAALRKHEAPGYPCRPCNSPATMTRADWRRALIHDPAFTLAPGPELSSPDAAKPVLWIDNPDRSPLIRNQWQGREFLNHRGWYTDEHEDETLEACAVELDASPGLIFEAVLDSCSGSLRVMLDEFQTVDFSECENYRDADQARADAARDAIRSADSTAEREAEEERDYQREETRKMQAEEARADLAANRATVRALISELREICAGPAPAIYPAATQAVRDRLADLLRDRRDTLDNLRNLTA